MEGAGVEAVALVAEPKRRGRKRKNREAENVTADNDGKKRVVEMRTRAKRLVGMYVRKEFGGSGMFLGKISYYDSGLYRVDYEDGDCEDLESCEVRGFLIEENALDEKWLERKKKLDEMVSKKYANQKSSEPPAENGVTESDNVVVGKAAEIAPSSAEVTNCDDNDKNQVDGDGDLSSEMSEDDTVQESSKEVVEVPLAPPPVLPPSSRNIGVSEDFVSHLLSVYSFLRSFSIQLFLSPFGLDDFVGSINCNVQNTLLDSVHVALMRILTRHLEKLSSDGSELAAKCLRCLEWSMLDALTWPVYLIHYLMIFGYMDGPEWKCFYNHVLEKDYYTLSAGRKLIILQILCDSVLDSDELRTEIDMREESEVGPDSDAGMVITPSDGPRRVHPRYSKTSACKDQEAMEIMGVGCGRSKVGGSDAASDLDQDGNGDECRLCGMDGTLLCCDGCPSSYHSRCIGVSKLAIPEGDWFCPECMMNKIGPTVTRETTLKGGEVFGTDPYEQVFVGTCDHLLVLRGSINSASCIKYYNRNDIPRLLESLLSNTHHRPFYAEICKGIIQYWEIPEGVLSSFSQISEIGLFDQTSLHASIQSGDLAQKAVNNVETNPSQALVASVPSEQYQMKAAVPTDLLCRPADQLASTRNSIHKEAAGRVNGRTSRKVSGYGEYMGFYFKTQGYINNYLHGDFAASAAASLAALSSNESHASSLRAVDQRKAVSAIILLQGKAFSSVVVRFFWPHTEKKHVEVPRERCSWCYCCKATVSSKRGCLLNAAASNAVKGAMKVLAGLRPVKSVEGSISGIATYVMFMEESLSGLTVGPFLNLTFRSHWRRQLEQATTFAAIKTLLLEFEENIRTVALSGDWVKLVDGPSSDSSPIQSGAVTAAGSTQKRRPGRRGRKPAAAAVEVVADDCQDTSTDITWWRGGKLLKFIFQKAILPHGMVKKAARQGGSRRIPSIYYAEGPEMAKRNRRLMWRAAVEMSKNVSQLAIQVRYLDLHIKWADLVRPEQSLQEAKGPETETSIFRNAFICDKKLVGDEIRYGVAFGSQKHLPSKVMKNVTEKEQGQDGKEKYWFSEMRIPLYLIREYEENVAKLPSPSAEVPPLPSVEMSLDMFAKWQKKQLKVSRKDIFLYLSRKRDNKEKVYCASCHRSVLLGNAIKCITCQGLFHEHCTVSSTVHGMEEVEYLITCKRCYAAKAVCKSEKNNESPTSPLLQRQDVLNTVVVKKDERLVKDQSLLSPVSVAPSSTTQLNKSSDSATQSKSSKCSWGLIWKKKSGEDTAVEFRLKNILLKGNPYMDTSRPNCHLCHQPYNPDLMYIRCENCNNWYHAEAVELKEDKVLDLAGFKCCKCRRIRSPKCPFGDGENKKLPEVRRLTVRGPRLETPAAMGPNNPRDTSGKQAEAARPWLHREENAYAAYDDPLLVSYARFQQPSENYAQMINNAWSAKNVSGPQKLPVRRNVKPEKDEEICVPNNSRSGGSSASLGGNILNTAGELSSPHFEWDVLSNGGDENMMFNYDCLNYEDMEFEPQTYFSFNELLASDDGGSTDVPLDNGTMNLEASFALETNEDPDASSSTPLEFTNDALPCKMCTCADPSPDLFCQTCGVLIHSHCSPWIEPWSGDCGWKCGHCREWQ